MTAARQRLVRWGAVAALAIPAAGLGLNWYNGAQTREIEEHARAVAEVKLEREKAIAEATQRATLTQKVDQIARDVSDIKTTLDRIAPRATIGTPRPVGVAVR